jgi:hypothetical protein
MKRIFGKIKSKRASKALRAFRIPGLLACLFLIVLLCPAYATAQGKFNSPMISGHELSLSSIIFDSKTENVYRIPLSDYGLRKSNYSVMVSMMIAGDPEVYHVPGDTPYGSSFGFRLKAGRHGGGDSLMIIRRTGTEPILISRINIVAFRAKTRSGVMRYDKAFSRFVLDKYLSGHLRKGDETECYFSFNP